MRLPQPPVGRSEQAVASTVASAIAPTLRVQQATVSLTGSRTTSNGYLIVPATLSRAGVLDWGPGQREYVSREALGAKVADWSVMILVEEHPTEGGIPVLVTAANSRWYQVGFVGGDARMEGDYLRGSLVITDQYAIENVRAGKRELSIGALFSRDYAPGIVPKGGADAGSEYEYLVHTVDPNHVAITVAGKCGPACSLELHSHDAPAPDLAPDLLTLIINAPQAHGDTMATTHAPGAPAPAPAAHAPCGCATEIAQLRAQSDAERARAETAIAQLAAHRAGESARVTARIALLSDVRGICGDTYAPPADATDLRIMSDAVAVLLPAMGASVSAAAAAGNEAYVRAAYESARAIPRTPAAPVGSAELQILSAAGAALTQTPAAPAAQPESLEAMRLAELRKLSRCA